MSSKDRGFASMDKEKRREIASKGGKASHAKGTAHEFNSDEARDAGRKGGMTVSKSHEHMVAIGRLGGQARGRARRGQQESQPPQPEGDADSSADKVGTRPDRWKNV